MKLAFLFPIFSHDTAANLIFVFSESGLKYQ